MADDDTLRTQAVDALVVDDDLDAVEELIEYLSRAGLSCAKAGDGWSALNLLADGCRPNVVVSDLRMPELDGLQFAEHLNRMSDQERPEIIFISGNAGYDDAVEAIRLGARDMLTKPIDGPRLVRAVKSALLVRQLRRGERAGGDAKGKAASRTPAQRKRASLDDLRAVRKVRSRYFPSELFSDPCWEMLLDLYDGQLAGQDVTVTSLGAASGASLTTALRRMDSLQSHGLIERSEDPADKRRTIVRLSRNGLEAVERFFDTYSRRRSD
ncbi:MAG: response regulator [Enhydrobacter sp.]|nr:MAG: response regulator [Enhydrobacter sp.]